MRGHILAPYNNKNRKLLNERRFEYERIDDDRKGAFIWTEAIQNAGGGSGSDISIFGRRRSSSDDRLLGEEPARNASGNNERVRTSFEAKEGTDEIIRKLREMYGVEKSDLDEEIPSNSRELRI